ncbi:hypothetical protein HYFRA_00001551 [Hymenoscyphus fraxineus]|uniref:Uncharacterized protein n=1 Tax=Hymenoscyphus fraxineus TaxID=746836 RepID=A0A9N9PY73_9HELO|nr:hypothetical protein HYFRA_00001551 [Hymenoscyphus fraxineus]
MASIGEHREGMQPGLYPNISMQTRVPHHRYHTATIPKQTPNPLDILRLALCNLQVKSATKLKTTLQSASQCGDRQTRGKRELPIQRNPLAAQDLAKQASPIAPQPKSQRAKEQRLCFWSDGNTQAF